MGTLVFGNELAPQVKVNPGDETPVPWIDCVEPNPPAAPPS